MARSQIEAIGEDLQTDSGAALFSIVQGEQFEFPVTLSFIQNASLGYEFECVIIEGLNVANQETPPIVARPGGISEQLTVFVPPWKSTWSAVAAYSRDDLVMYNNIVYTRLIGAYVVDATPPDVATAAWAEYNPNVVYIRFPEALSNNWSVQPSTKSNVYGFIELRVTEPSGTRYKRTWKPLRGLIELLYSPTKLVT